MAPRTVMVVDDDPFIREVVSAALGTQPDVSAFTYGTVDEALAAAAALRPDIVVLDYTLPGTDGLEALLAFRRVLHPLPPVLFLTAREDPGLADRLLEAGATGVLSKPFDPTLIAARILGAGAAARDARLDAVAANFRASLPRTMDEIDRDWNALRREWQRPLAEGLLMRVHKLAGAAGLFKLDAFGRAAHGVEIAVQTELDGEARGERPEARKIEEPVAALWKAAVAAMGR